MHHVILVLASRMNYFSRVSFTSAGYISQLVCFRANGTISRRKYYYTCTASYYMQENKKWRWKRWNCTDWRKRKTQTKWKLNALVACICVHRGIRHVSDKKVCISPIINSKYFCGGKCFERNSIFLYYIYHIYVYLYNKVSEYTWHAVRNENYISLLLLF